MPHISLVALMLLSLISCLKSRGGGGVDIQENVTPPAIAKAIDPTIAYLPPKPKVPGDQLTATNLVVQPVHIGTQQIVHLTVTPDVRADFLQLSICQDTSPSPLCFPKMDNAEVFIATDHYFPNAPIGHSFVQVRACVKPEDALDVAKLCGAWSQAPYFMAQANPDDAWKTAIAGIHDGLQKYLEPCTDLQGQINAYLKAHPDQAAGKDTNSILLQDFINMGEFTCAQLLQNTILTQLTPPTDTGTGTGTDTGTDTKVAILPPPVDTTTTTVSGDPTDVNTDPQIVVDTNPSDSNTNVAVDTASGGKSNQAELAGGITLTVLGAVLAAASLARYAVVSKQGSANLLAKRVGIVEVETIQIPEEAWGTESIFLPPDDLTQAKIDELKKLQIQLAAERTKLANFLKEKQAEFQSKFDELTATGDYSEPTRKTVNQAQADLVARKAVLDQHISDEITKFLENPAVKSELANSKYLDAAKAAVSGKNQTPEEWQKAQIRNRFESILGIAENPQPRLATVKAKGVIQNLSKQIQTVDAKQDFAEKLQDSFRTSLLTALEPNGDLRVTDDIQLFMDNVVVRGLMKPKGAVKQGSIQVGGQSVTVVNEANVGLQFGQTVQNLIPTQLASDQLSVEKSQITADSLETQFQQDMAAWNQTVTEKQRIEAEMSAAEEYIKTCNSHISIIDQLHSENSAELDKLDVLTIKTTKVRLPDKITEVQVPVKSDPVPVDSAGEKSVLAGKGAAVVGAGLGIAMILSGILVSLDSQGLLLAGSTPDAAATKLQAAGRDAYDQAMDIALAISSAKIDLLQLKINQLQGK